MKKNIRRILIVIVFAVAVLLLGKGAFQPKPVVSTVATYTNSSIGLMFNYPQEYKLSDQSAATNTQGLLRTITLSPDATQNGSELPPTITVTVFKNTLKQFPLAWAQQNPTQSLYALKKSSDRELVVGGANALGYTADGLYASDTVIVAHDSYIYVFNGQYMDSSAPITADFKTIVTSVQFIPSSAPTIDAAACEGALAYMSFPDAKAADIFVAECKEGKHPEVFTQNK